MIKIVHWVDARINIKKTWNRVQNDVNLNFQNSENFKLVLHTYLRF